MMGYAAAMAAGFDRSQFDFNVLFIPKCWAQSFAGIGWVGVPGALQNSQLNDYDASVAHELGHNLGANHASYLTNTDGRGAAAFGDVDALSAQSDWVEYGSPHSTMGQGDFMDFQADFVIEGKAVFDWVSDAEMAEVTPFDSNGVGLCKPCGPFFLSPTDATTKPASGATMGLSIVTATANRYYFVEHRTSSTGYPSSVNAALITWADIRPQTGWDGETGIWENSVLADCTPETSDWVDAGCVPGASIVLDIGTSAENSMLIEVLVKQVGAGYCVTSLCLLLVYSV